MKITEDILIEKYLRNQLSKEELTSFNKRFNLDTLFKEKVKLEKQLSQSLNENQWSAIDNSPLLNEYKEVFKSKEISSLKEQLKEENAIYQNSFKKKFLTYYLVASILVFFISISFLLQKESSQKLYSTYLNQTELNSFITRGDNKNELIEAQTFFENKDYAKALTIFEKAILNKKNVSSNLYLYIGITQLKLDKTEKALSTFNALIHSDLLDAPKGYWFKALLYLKDEDTKKSKEILNEIVEKKLYNYQKAKKLLLEL